MSNDHSNLSRRNALKCMAYGGAGTLFVMAGGVFTPVDLARAADDKQDMRRLGRPLFLQISDTHIGFAKDANPDVNGTLTRTIALVNAMPEQPALIIHTGDITHLSKPAEFDLAQQMLGQLRVTELHTVPGEHDTTDPTVSEYFNRFGKASNNKGYYSFDHAGVHFVALINVLQFKDGGLGTLGPEQTRLGGRRSQIPVLQHANRGLRPHAAVDRLRALGLGHVRRRSAHGPAAPVRFGHGAERAHPSDRPEGGGQRDLSHRAIDGVSAAGRRRRCRPRALEGRLPTNCARMLGVTSVSVPAASRSPRPHRHDDRLTGGRHSATQRKSDLMKRSTFCMSWLGAALGRRPVRRPSVAGVERAPLEQSAAEHSEPTPGRSGPRQDPVPSLRKLPLDQRQRCRPATSRRGRASRRKHRRLLVFPGPQELRTDLGRSHLEPLAHQPERARSRAPRCSSRSTTRKVAPTSLPTSRSRSEA